MRAVYPNVTMDKFMESLQPEHITKWNDGTPDFKVIQELPEENTFIVYSTSRKITMVEQRNFVSKMVNKKGYHINDDGSEAAHVNVRVTGEHPDYPSTTKGFTRGVEHCVG